MMIIIMITRITTTMGRMIITAITPPGSFEPLLSFDESSSEVSGSTILSNSQS
jgi:hypothetical protein